MWFGIYRKENGADLIHFSADTIGEAFEYAHLLSPILHDLYKLDCGDYLICKSIKKDLGRIKK